MSSEHRLPLKILENSMDDSLYRATLDVVLLPVDHD